MICALFFSANVSAQQCGINNVAFKSGERLTYNLYFNWKFVWFKVGEATMNTDLTTFEGKQAWRSSLVTGGNKRLDKFFTMRDTLLSYCDTNRRSTSGREPGRASDTMWTSCGIPIPRTPASCACTALMPTVRSIGRMPAIKTASTT